MVFRERFSASILPHGRMDEAGSCTEAGTRTPLLPKHKARQVRRALACLDSRCVHPQTQSPLFSRLPPELRLMIWELALAQYPDYSSPKRPYSFVPERSYRLRVETALLLTCHRVWVEARRIPLRKAVFIVSNIRVRPGVPFYHFYGDRPRISRLTAANVDDLNHVLCIGLTQLYDLEDYLVVLPNFRPKFLTLRFLRSSWSISDPPGCHETQLRRFAKNYPFQPLNDPRNVIVCSSVIKVVIEVEIVGSDQAYVVEVVETLMALNFVRLGCAGVLRPQLPSNNPNEVVRALSRSGPSPCIEDGTSLYTRWPLSGNPPPPPLTLIAITFSIDGRGNEDMTDVLEI